MTFEGQYLSYAEYQSLGGSAIGTMPFNILEFEARKQIDLRTQNRLIGIDTIPDEVKLCTFHLINRIKSYDETITASTESNGSIASESTDGYSISYNQVNSTQIKEIINSKSAEIDNIIMNDLYGLIVNKEHVIYNGAR